MSPDFQAVGPDFQGTPDPREPDFVFWACVSVLTLILSYLYYILSRL